MSTRQQVSQVQEEVDLLKDDHYDTDEFDCDTNEFGQIFGVAGATVRRGYCVNGHYMGVKPAKMPNGRLRWPGRRGRQVIQKAAA